MKKTFKLDIEGRNRERVLDAIRHELKKYVRRERDAPLPEGADFWDFKCKFGATRESSQVVHLAELGKLAETFAAEGGSEFYVEILAKPGQRKQKKSDAA